MGKPDPRPGKVKEIEQYMIKHPEPSHVSSPEDTSGSSNWHPPSQPVLRKPATEDSDGNTTDLLREYMVQYFNNSLPASLKLKSLLGTVKLWVPGSGGKDYTGWTLCEDGTVHPRRSAYTKIHDLDWEEFKPGKLHENHSLTAELIWVMVSSYGRGDRAHIAGHRILCVRLGTYVSGQTSLKSFRGHSGERIYDYKFSSSVVLRPFQCSIY